ncbi:MAG: hypothetical protein KHW73_11060, partial [Clostridium sp.]|nr:hypothetical protein [Clostridium sp.]
RYALNERECPRDAKLFYGITENKKSANEHLTQTQNNHKLQKEKKYCRIRRVCFQNEQKKRI